jgi:hypothetical protein
MYNLAAREAVRKGEYDPRSGDFEEPCSKLSLVLALVYFVQPLAFPLASFSCLPARLCFPLLASVSASTLFRHVIALPSNLIDSPHKRCVAFDRAYCVCIIITRSFTQLYPPGHNPCGHFWTQTCHARVCRCSEETQSGWYWKRS